MLGGDEAVACVIRPKEACVLAGVPAWKRLLPVCKEIVRLATQRELVPLVETVKSRAGSRRVGHVFRFAPTAAGFGRHGLRGRSRLFHAIVFPALLMLDEIAASGNKRSLPPPNNRSNQRNKNSPHPRFAKNVALALI